MGFREYATVERWFRTREPATWQVLTSLTRQLSADDARLYVAAIFADHRRGVPRVLLHKGDSAYGAWRKWYISLPLQPCVWEVLHECAHLLSHRTSLRPRRPVGVPAGRWHGSKRVHHGPAFCRAYADLVREVAS